MDFSFEKSSKTISCFSVNNPSESTQSICFSLSLSIYSQKYFYVHVYIYTFVYAYITLSLIHFTISRTFFILIYIIIILEHITLISSVSSHFWRILRMLELSFSTLFSRQGGRGPSGAVFPYTLIATTRSVLFLSLLFLSFASFLSISSSSWKWMASAVDSGPIPAASCRIVNPNPDAPTTCDGLPQPATNLFVGLPWTLPVYKECVVARCNCTGATDTTVEGYEPNGMYCTSSGVFAESGYTACNDMLDCFETFWSCTADATWGRHLSGTTLESAEQAYVNDIIKQGKQFGAPVSDSEAYKSCALIQCQAAESRLNCGLLTCYPDNSQCAEFLYSPRAPNGHVTCSNACQAALLLMAFTIVIVALSLTCFLSCPPRARVVRSSAKLASDVTSTASESFRVSSDDEESRHSTHRRQRLSSQEIEPQKSEENGSWAPRVERGQ